MDADELYRLAPEDFTAARDAAAKRAKADGDKQRATALAALRRPTVSAWLVNRLADTQRELLDSLLDLGPELAAAQSGGDAAALRALGAQRRQLVDAVVATATEATGRSVTAAVREEVAATLEAALSDPASAEAVRSGRLVRALSYAGFGTVDLAGAVAPASAAPQKKTKKTAAPKADRKAERVAAAERSAHDAAGRLDDAVRACEQAERERVAAEVVVEERTGEVDRLTAELSRAQQARDQSAQQAHAVRESAEKAVAKVRRAQDAAEAARTELDRLRRG